MNSSSVDKRQVLEAAQQMVKSGMVVGTSGNVSMRTSELNGNELIAITPSGRHYEFLTMSDIAVVDSEGKRIEGELPESIETMLHIGIYQIRKRVNAIIHAHPPFCGVLAVAGIGIPPILDDQVVYLGGDIKLSEYAVPGSRDMVDNVISALGTKNAVLIANHGALCVGSDMKEALTNCEILEQTAKIYVHALAIGKINSLPEEALEMELACFYSNYGEE